MTRFNLEEYLGLWYEIAKIPSDFETPGAYNVTAEYMMNTDGTIKVINTEVLPNGQENSIIGTAVPVDSSNRRLQVDFFGVSDTPKSKKLGNYWILEYAYGFSVVGGPQMPSSRGPKKYLWILSRDPHPDAYLYHLILKTLNRHGYSFDELEPTYQE